ncbi:MAG: nitroreductase family deazaflavin-dependent oxidoreductase [Aldersonia sp.]|nr:nitroreductase family deazaflavin-dependent oxidoreductase [Aldersonia sp.]
MRLSPGIMRLEGAIRQVSNGSWGVLDVAGVPSVEITVAGRKSGKPRTTSLLYVPDGDRMLLVGSNWGRRKHPVWSTNLKEADTVQIREGAAKRTASVRLLTGAEREQAWETAVEFWPGYKMEFERSGGREFRIFALTPQAAQAPINRCAR